MISSLLFLGNHKPERRGTPERDRRGERRKEKDERREERERGEGEKERHQETRDHRREEGKGSFSEPHSHAATAARRGTALEHRNTNTPASSSLPATTK